MIKTWRKLSNQNIASPSKLFQIFNDINVNIVKTVQSECRKAFKIFTDMIKEIKTDNSTFRTRRAKVKLLQPNDIKLINGCLCLKQILKYIDFELLINRNNVITDINKNGGEVHVLCLSVIQT